MRQRRTKAELNEEREEALSLALNRYKLSLKPSMDLSEVSRYFFEAGWEALRKCVYNPVRK